MKWVIIPLEETMAGDIVYNGVGVSNNSPIVLSWRLFVCL